MSFDLYDRVIIKKNGVIGQIIDITETDSGTVYTVECDVPGNRSDADYHSKWPLYDCKSHDILKTIKVMYISDKKSIFFKKGNVYDAYIPQDDKSGKFFAFHLEDMDEPGDYALPSSMFEVVHDSSCLGTDELPMYGLKTRESEKFNAFFALIQEEAKKLNAVFFADAGDGNDFETPDMEGENMMGWLIPSERAKEFEPLWARSAVDDSWADFFGWAIWSFNGDAIEIRFEI